MVRSERIARSVVRVLTADEEQQKQREKKSSVGKVLAFFGTLVALYQLPLSKIAPARFAKLRKQTWHIDEDTYVGSFTAEKDEQPETALQAIGDMGYSGSTFFDTKDKRYLVKSIPRPFEHTFFRDDLLEPYSEHMAANAASLLVRICDFLASPKWPVGAVLGTAPTHHIVMENILYGKGATSEADGHAWTHWDLKPQSYFVPERDIANGKLTSEATKAKLADDFQGKMVLSEAQANEFLSLMARDTQLLADCNAVDYSLFLVLITSPPDDPFVDPESEQRNPDVIPQSPPFVPPAAPSWRTGVQSPDPRYVWRAVLLDFFWAKHKTKPKLMTWLIAAWNACISRQGHMTITTDAVDYRETFLKMCRDIVEVREEGDDNKDSGSKDGKKEAKVEEQEVGKS